MKLISHGPDETFAIGALFAKKADHGQIYALCGELGAGKTVFAKGFAKGLGVEDIVNSPTFTILQVYEDGRLPLYHFDLYRLGDASELEFLGYEEYFFGEGVCLIEWPERAEDYLSADVIYVRFIKDESDLNVRRLEIDDR